MQIIDGIIIRSIHRSDADRLSSKVIVVMGTPLQQN
jgi:predicted transcriptional regulator with HTH domain